MIERPETKYARSGDLMVAYQVTGEGNPVDLVHAPGTVSHLELFWDIPEAAAFIERLSSFARLIRFDKRGTGMSDRPPGPATLEERTDDIRAVMDAAGSERAFVFGSSEGGSMACVFAATYPERTSGLILWGTQATWIRTDDYPWGGPGTRRSPRSRTLAEHGMTDTYLFGPGAGAGGGHVGGGEGTDPPAVALRDHAGRPRGPRTDEPGYRHPRGPPEHPRPHPGHEPDGRSGGQRRRRARPGRAHRGSPVRGVRREHAPVLPGSEPGARWPRRSRSSSTGSRPAFGGDRALATVLFTDIVDSTRKAAELGDRAWRDLVERHHALVRDLLARSRGTEMDTAGDGFFATFDGPARAVRCAMAAVEAVRPLGIEIRAGVHTGEVETIDAKAGGIAVIIGARIAGTAAASEVLVSSTVKELVAGSGSRSRTPASTS